MFCSQCGAQIQAESKFCQHCGAALTMDHAMAADANIANQETAAGQAIQIDSHVVHQMIEPSPGQIKPPHSPKSRWILPLSSLFLSLVAILSIYLYQMDINRDVNELLAEGEASALEGKWNDALTNIEAALKKRPEHPVLINDRELLQDAILLDNRIQSTGSLVSMKKFSDGLRIIDSVKNDLKTRSGAIYDILSAKAVEHEEIIVVQKVNTEFLLKKTIQELTPLLNMLKDYPGEDAGKSAQQVKAKITDIAYKKATEELEAKYYAKALLTIDEGLKLDEGNTILLTLRTTVEAEQKAFEEAAQQRIQLAVEAASREDLMNRTEAVEILSLNAYTDDNGYFNIQGSVKNVAKRSISSIVIHFDIVDQFQNTIDQKSVYVSPDILNIGETGEFFDYYYNNLGMASFNVTSMEWVIN